MEMVMRILTLVLTLIFFAGCFSQHQSPQRPDTKQTVSSAPKDSDSIKLPDNRHSDQAILAIFMVGSTQTLINGRQITMNSPAANRNDHPFVPAEYLALTVGLKSSEIRPEGRHNLFIAGKIVNALNPTYTDENGIVYA
jgi:PBP1b-binding outer membrane lipoprotein LpoB